MSGEHKYHGHKTMLDGSHVPLTSEEAESLWKAVEAAKEKRAADMPGVQDALGAVLAAQERLHDLGWWRGGGLRVRKGDECAVAEFGSTGIWSGFVDAEGKYVHYGDSVSRPRDVWLKPLADLTDDERAHMERCDQHEREAFEAEMNRLAEPTP